jgi:hypothetical protein
MTLNYRPVVAGKIMEVELHEWPGTWIRVWLADNGLDYFCHGLTFGGKSCPVGPVSPFSGEPVEKILAMCYREVEAEANSRKGDVLVWRDAGLVGTPHSAVLTSASAFQGETKLGYSSILRTKNGMAPECDSTLEELVNLYGESYRVYRRTETTKAGENLP